MVAILTDNGAGFTKSEIDKLNLNIIPLGFYIDDKEYLYDEEISEEEFFDLLLNANDIRTSQPSIASVEDMYRSILKDYEHILYLPMTSGLSSAYSTGMAVSMQDEFKGKITVIDGKKISVLQKFAVYDIINFLSNGCSPDDIKTKIENDNKNTSIYIMVDTLTYLKKGGRISSIVATVGSLLNIKPIMFSDGGPFDVAKKERNIQNAKTSMLNLIENDMSNKFGSTNCLDFSIGVAYSKNKDEAIDLEQKVVEKFGSFSREIPIDSLARFICCHIGPNAIGLGVYKNLNEN